MEEWAIGDIFFGEKHWQLNVKIKAFKTQILFEINDSFNKNSAHQSGYSLLHIKIKRHLFLNKNETLAFKKFLFI